MKYSENTQLLERFPHQEIINKLIPLISKRRQNRINSVITNRINSIHLVLESPADIHNALAAVRSAEAFGILNVHIINPDSPAIHERCITQGAIFWVNTHYYNSLPEFLAKMPKTPRYLAGAQMQGSVPVNELPIDKPLWLMLGNENRGLSDAAIAACDTLYRIPMFGMSESLNLSVSASISLYNTTTRHRTLLDGKPDLSTKEQQQLKAQYCLNSVNPKFIPGLLNSTNTPKH